VDGDGLQIWHIAMMYWISSHVQLTSLGVGQKANNSTP